MKKMIKNKRGWIKIVEAFVAILLIAGIILVILNKGYVGREDYSKEVFETERAILLQIQTNDSLRNRVIGTAPPFPADAHQDIIDLINNEVPSHLECEAKICELNDDCGFSRTMNKDIYAQSVVISGTETTYSPRQLKLFCWVKG